MIYGELTRRRIEETDKGVIGTIVFLCDWPDVDPVLSPEIPNRGDSWPGFPALRCVRRVAEEGEIGQATVTCHYSTEGDLAESYLEESIDASLEPGQALDGWTWENVQLPVTDEIAPSIPGFLIVCRKRNAELPLEVVEANIGKVNSKRFRGINAGYLRFEGARAESSVSGNGTVISADTVYTFRTKGRPWNEMWRRPMQARDSDGNLLFWQNISEDEPFHSTDPLKIGAPVWINEVPGLSSHPGGIGGYDKPKFDGKYMHAAVDFAAVLGLPKKAGDE